MRPLKFDEALQRDVEYGWFKLSLVDLNGAPRISAGLNKTLRALQSSTETFQLIGIFGASWSLEELVGAQGNSV